MHVVRLKRSPERPWTQGRGVRAPPEDVDDDKLDDRDHNDGDDFDGDGDDDGDDDHLLPLCLHILVNDNPLMFPPSHVEGGLLGFLHLGKEKINVLFT